MIADSGSDAPVAIGGVGGSGTRVLAEVLQAAGRYLGSDLNAARDNLWFTLLFKHVEVLDWTDERFAAVTDSFVSRMVDGATTDSAVERVAPLALRASSQHSRDWLEERLRTFRSSDDGARGRRWGWKEPNTHLVLDRLAGCIEDLRYVHVARSGLDMAFSSNQNQPLLWGHALGAPYDGSPTASLRYWRLAHERVLRIGSTMPDRFLFVRFEDLCSEPERTLRRILDFCGDADAGPMARRLAPLVRPPSTIGRTVDTAGFDAEDVEYVASLGFALPR